MSTAPRACREPDDLVGSCAADVAARFDARDPRGALRRLGLTLRVSAAPLRTRGRLIHAAWDPLLRRIELCGAHGGRGDGELAHSLGHELGHALRDTDHGPAGEARAERFAEAWCAALGPVRQRELAGALRALAAGAAAP